ncbi:MAG: hypothetical protein ACRENG_33075 [bacterium]
MNRFYYNKTSDVCQKFFDTKLGTRDQTMPVCQHKSFYLTNHLSFSIRAKLFIILLLLVSSVAAQSIDPSLYQDLRYRTIGPFRAGRTVGAVGVPAQPNVFYIGVNNGGV